MIITDREGIARNMNELRERIKIKSSLMTPMQKRIADFMIEHPERFALKNIREIATELGTSKSTIVRLSQLLGYSGFYELRSFFLKNLSDGLDPLFRYKQILTTQDNAINYLESIAIETITNINTTLNVIDQEQFKKAVLLLKEAREIHTMGRGISTYMAELATYFFSRVGIKSTSLVHSGLSFAEQIISMHKNDIILAFSFPPYTNETIRAAEYAREKGIAVIAITDKLTSGIVQYSDIQLQVVVESMTISNSMSGVLFILYALTSQLARELKKKTLDTIKSVEHVREKHSGN